MTPEGSHRRRRSQGVAIGLLIVIRCCTTAVSGRVVAREASRSAVEALDLVTSGCGTVEDLNDRVGHRSSQIRLTNPSAAASTLKAEIKNVGENRKEIILTVVKRSGRRFSRHMQAKDCDEALEALALLIVLTLDPAAAATPPKEPKAGTARGTATGSDPRATPKPQKRTRIAAAEASSAAQSERPPNPPTAQPEPRATTPAVTSPGPPSPVLSAANGTADKESETTSKTNGETNDETKNEKRKDDVVPDDIASRKMAIDERWKRRAIVAAGVGGIVIGGPAPQAMVGGALYGVWGWDRDSPWSPAIVLAAGHAERNGLAAQGGTADFALDAVQLEICPVWFGTQRRFGARACAMGLAGRLTARGAQTLDPQVHRRAFASFGGSGALIFQPGWHVEVMATGGFGLPFERYTFQFEPAAFYRVARISVMGGLSVGFRFF